ncbi:MAG: type IV toxin-antitoxin system AbiEi family antitoxin domain-containing protein [Gemmatimonadota bacterium]|nr:type IV toxin-antitoxin system AbiEi family antitoxin domain-containing protein [Gemmatimonadota bacterium]
MSKNSPENQVLELAQQGLLRVCDLTSRGLHPEYLRRLYQKGLVRREGRGLYIAADAEISVHYGLAQVAKRIPHGVICLLSALSFHEIGTQLPHQVWMAIDRRAAKPKMQFPPLRVMRFSGAALTEGIETYRIEGVPVQIFNPAKTVADCFKYRNKIGLDIALEALKECIRDRRTTMDDLWHFAQVCRMTNVMRPYMEAIVA